MKIRTIGVLLLTATLTLLGCSDPAGPEVVGEVIFSEPDFSETAEVDFPGIVMEQEGRAIEVRGADWQPCLCALAGVVELHGKNQLTVSITNLHDGNDLAWRFAFRATISDLEQGSYEVRVTYAGIGSEGELNGVVFTDTAVID